MKEKEKKDDVRKNLPVKMDSSNLLIFMSHVPMPIILQFHQRRTREAKGPRTMEEVKCPAHVSGCKYLKVNLIQVAELSLMSSTMKVICMRFS